MVSGLVTSPLDQDRICFEDASPILIASKLLMSIKVVPYSLGLSMYSASCSAWVSSVWPPSPSASTFSSDSSAASASGALTPDRSMPSSSAARSRSSSSSRISTPAPSSERTSTSSASDCISFSSTLNDSGMEGSAMFSPFTIAS